VALSSLYFLERVQSIDNNLDRKTSQLAASIALASEYGVITGNRIALQDIVQNNLRDPEIVSIEIYSGSNDLLATVRQNFGQNAEFKQQLTANNTLLLSVKELIYPSQVVIDDYQRSNPEEIDFGNGPVGYVRVSATRYFANQEKRIILIKTSLFTLLSLLIVAAFAVFMANSLIRPLTRITNGLTRIRAGNLEHKIPEESGGEVGLLEKNVNAMAQALKLSQENERRIAINALNFEKSKAQTTLESLGEGVITTDNLGNITYVNPIAERLTGYTFEQALSKQLSEIFKVYSDTTNEEIDYPIQACIEHGEIIRHDALLNLLRKDGERFVIRDTATPIRDPEQKIVGAVLIFDDFSTIQAMAEKLSYQASHDDLTGIFNRREFEAQLEHALQQAIHYQVENSVCYIDLDQFKIVNDTCGHVAGDELLKSLTQILKGKIRHHDIFARLGGDEFGIILKDCPHDKAEELADLIRKTVQEFVFFWEQQKFQIGASVGLVHLSDKFNSVSEIMIASDSACYIAKEKGRNRVHVYVENDDDQIRRAGEMRWMQRIQHAIEVDNLVLYAQTIQPLSADAQLPMHYEFLLRLKEHDVIHTPYSFLPAAERYNLMPEIDKWVITNALSAISTQLNDDVFLKNSYFHINLSGQSLSVDKFQDFVYESLQQMDSLTSNIIFEITETAAIANMQRAIDFIKSIKQLGCRFALDDFGSGLSSFGYLTSLPIDYIKIDGKIVRDITYNQVNLSIVKSINEISHVMQLKTMAEFVENESIMKKLVECNIDYGQGYAISKPQPLDELLERVKQHPN
jgi:diguanylate cyclase (GGDEF)-like protein/PAS domain S-box-containing protein